MRISDWSSDVCSSDLGVRAIVGTRLDLADGTAMLLYPTDKAAYGCMCRLLSAGKARAGTGECLLGWGDVEEWNDGLLGMLLPHHADSATEPGFARTSSIFATRAHIDLPHNHPHKQLLRKVRS